MEENSLCKNAFTYFSEDYCAEQILLGRNITKKEACLECIHMWNDLEPDRRQYYCDIANPMLHRTNRSGEMEPVPPNMEWLDPVTGEYGERWLRYLRSGDELFYLKNTVKDERTLKMQNFYMVHFNYFCKTSLKKYIPAELALVEFNLSEGVKNVYHTFINPGVIPLGFAYEAKKISLEGHGIPPPPLSRGEKDMGKVVEAIKDFLKYNTGPTGKYPPLFTVEDNVLPAMHMLNDMVPYTEEQPAFIVYPTHRMFYWVKNKCSDICGKGAGFLDEAVALKELERDCFRFIVEIACDFHKQYECKFPTCSQSIAKRLAYTICDHCCRHLNIPLVGGKHVHKNFRRVVSLERDDRSEEETEGPREEATNHSSEKESDAPEQSVSDEDEVYYGPGTANPHYFRPTHFECPEAAEMYKNYNEMVENLIHGDIDFDFDEERNFEQILKNLDLDKDSDEDPYYVRLEDRDDNDDNSPFPTLEEELAGYRRNQGRKVRNMVLARIKAREAREALEALEAVQAYNVTDGPKTDDLLAPDEAFAALESYESEQEGQPKEARGDGEGTVSDMECEPGEDQDIGGARESHEYRPPAV